MRVLVQYVKGLVLVVIFLHCRAFKSIYVYLLLGVEDEEKPYV
jgi:hypothetical protein